MKLIVVYALLAAGFMWQAVRNGGEWWHGLVAIGGVIVMLIVGEKIADVFENGFWSIFDRVFSAPESVAPSQKRLTEQIPFYEGEVVEDSPSLCAVNPTPAKQIENQKTYNGGGGVFLAMPMYCDVCRHRSFHAYIDGVWVCQAPTHR